MNQTLVLLCVFVVVARIPRIVERWKAPLLRGPEWFFSIEVAVDFLNGPGAAILRNYRWRLFVPWAIEVPICAAIFAAGSNRVYIMYTILAITLFTRLNYYASRKAAEDQTRRFAVSGANEAPVAVALSLQPRTLGEYTNRWIEAAIVLSLGGALVWLAYRYATVSDWQTLRGAFSVTLIAIYLQAGLLLMKRAFVRARVAAPAENAEQYLAWRDSLRRLSTALCDYMRIACALLPPIALLASVTKPWQGSTAQTGTLVFVFGLTLIATWYEWRQRLQYLEVARRTKPANFLVLPDVPDARRCVCFRPSLPVLLLSSPKGYALNLASAPAKMAGLYVAGCAALWILLTR